MFSFIPNAFQEAQYVRRRHFRGNHSENISNFIIIFQVIRVAVQVALFFVHPLRRGAKRYSKMKTILNGAKFYRDGRFETGDLAIEDGKIVAIGGRVALEADDRAVDLTGCHVLPGLVDVHVHLREPGFRRKRPLRRVRLPPRTEVIPPFVRCRISIRLPIRRSIWKRSWL